MLLRPLSIFLYLSFSLPIYLSFSPSSHSILGYDSGGKVFYCALFLSFFFSLPIYLSLSPSSHSPFRCDGVGKGFYCALSLSFSLSLSLYLSMYPYLSLLLLLTVPYPFPLQLPLQLPVSLPLPLSLAVYFYCAFTPFKVWFRVYADSVQLNKSWNPACTKDGVVLLKVAVLSKKKCKYEILAFTLSDVILIIRRIGI